jgi:hypothetical protein
MIDAADFKPNSNFILLFKCTNDHVRDEKGNVLVTLTPKSLANTKWFEIVAVGPRCKFWSAEQVGKLSRVPRDFSHYMENYEATFGPGYWMVRETDLEGRPVLDPFTIDA